MKKIDISKCTKDMHFPSIQAQINPDPGNWWKLFKSFFTYRRLFRLTEDYVMWVPEINEWIFIPRNFLFDGASVPQILSSLYQSTGMLFYGSAPHDFGYRYNGLLHIYNGELKFVLYAKKELDNIFESLCASETKMQKASKIAKSALTIGGFVAWNANRKDNNILEKDFPEIF